MSTVTPLPRPEGPRAVVASEIRSLMGRYDRTQSDLALLLGITQSQFSKRLRGLIAFDVDELTRIADYFGVGVGTLFGEDVRRRPDGPDGPGGGSGGFVTERQTRLLAVAA